ncbi:hypothetical protein PVK06_043545 [Gossypium arboreum]|uniref:Uncharacterized protein n=1 Tax=Gossypium arboreum TaxID=29729 RepID=A0ABR0MNR7_GOSAR|nr:hypothetical protein PVK06_043545 [Gossypium arboreum]
MCRCMPIWLKFLLLQQRPSQIVVVVPYLVHVGVDFILGYSVRTKAVMVIWHSDTSTDSIVTTTIKLLRPQRDSPLLMMDRGCTMIFLDDLLVLVDLGSMLAWRELFRHNFLAALCGEDGHHSRILGFLYRKLGLLIPLPIIKLMRLVTWSGLLVDHTVIWFSLLVASLYYGPYDRPPMERDSGQCFFAPSSSVHRLHDTGQNIGPSSPSGQAIAGPNFGQNALEPTTNYVGLEGSFGSRQGLLELTVLSSSELIRAYCSSAQEEFTDHSLKE